MQVYERAAIEKWIRKYHTIPHSPSLTASVSDLRRCRAMAQYLASFRRAKQLRVEYQDM